MEPAGKIDGVIFAPDADPYRSPFSSDPSECAKMSAGYVDYMIKNEGNVAAILIEPIVGTNGVLVPPPDYLPMLREVADKHGVLAFEEPLDCCDLALVWPRRAEVVPLVNVPVGEEPVIGQTGAGKR